MSQPVDPDQYTLGSGRNFVSKNKVNNWGRQRKTSTSDLHMNTHTHVHTYAHHIHTHTDVCGGDEDFETKHLSSNSNNHPRTKDGYFL